MIDWTGPEPSWEPAQDSLGGNNSWQTPGINQDAEQSKSGGFDVGKVFKDALGKAINPLWPAEPIIEKGIEATGAPKLIGDLFTRGAFVLLGLIFITTALIMMSRPAREGVVEGIKEGLEG